MAFIFAIGLFSGTSYADKMKETAPNWSGIFVGVGGGYDSLSYGLNGNQAHSGVEEGCTFDGGIGDNTDCTNAEEIFSWPYGSYSTITDAFIGDDEWSAFATVQVGADMQIGSNLVVGVFADYDFSESSNDSVSTAFVGPGLTVGDFFDWGADPVDIGTVSMNIETGDTWSVGGRVGFLVSPKVLIYGLAGYTQTEVDANLAVTYANDEDNLVYADIAGKTVTHSVNLSDEVHGYFVGAGGEIQFSDKWSIKAEYRYTDHDLIGASASYTDLAHRAYADAIPPGLDVYTQSFNQDIELDSELHSVRALVVYKMGWH